MRFHGSCVARAGAGVLLLGPAGAGKSDLALRLVEFGFVLVADDQVEVEVEAGLARPPAALAGVLEVRGLGLFRVPFLPQARLALVVQIAAGPAERLPWPARHGGLGLPLVPIDAAAASAVARIGWALDAACGRRGQIAGAFAA